MVRKLEKIEKEMGYCDIKLEKERRLRRQSEFLQADIDALEKFMRLHESSVRNLHDLPFRKIAQQISLERARKDKLGPYFYRAKDDFVAAGIVEMLGNEQEILAREFEGVASKVVGFTGFGKKKTVLLEERKGALQHVEGARSSRVRRLVETFARVERQWNSLTEDALNLDDGIFYLVRNVDYIKSSKSFLISAKGSFDIDSWIDSDYSGDLFRHSNIGRAKEMIDGANRNLKLAQKELCSVVNLKFEIDGFEPVLVSFLDALFEDIFAEARVVKSIDVVEGALARMEKLLAQVRGKRETLHAKLERVEHNRADIFQRLGGEKRGRVSAN